MTAKRHHPRGLVDARVTALTMAVERKPRFWRGRPDLIGRANSLVGQLGRRGPSCLLTGVRRSAPGGRTTMLPNRGREIILFCSLYCCAKTVGVLRIGLLACAKPKPLLTANFLAVGLCVKG